MAGRNGSKGCGSGGCGRQSSVCNGGRGCGHGSGYTPKPRVTRTGLCKDLKGHIFDYGAHNAADLMQTTQEKIVQYMGSKYREDITNKLQNKTTVKSPSPGHSDAILIRHQEWENLVWQKQNNLMTALSACLVLLEAR